MSEKTITKCAACGYPITAEFEGQTVDCPMCSQTNEITQGVTIPTPLFVGFIAFALGMIVGPAIIASTSEGRTWLEKQARAKIRG